MLLHSNNITRIQIVSKVLSRDLPNTKLKFLVPLSICFTSRTNCYCNFDRLMSHLVGITEDWISHHKAILHYANMLMQFAAILRAVKMIICR